MSQRARDEALQKLVGLFEGIALDQVVSDDELSDLAKWLVEHADVMADPPFNAVAQRVERALAKQQLDSVDQEQLLRFAQWFRDEHGSDADRSAFLRLTGVCEGLLSDGKLSDEEIVDLRAWIDHFSDLRGVAAFDRLFSTLDLALADGKISEEERATLVEMCTAIRDVG